MLLFSHGMGCTFFKLFLIFLFNYVSHTYIYIYIYTYTYIYISLCIGVEYKINYMLHYIKNIKYF